VGVGWAEGGAQLPHCVTRLHGAALAQLNSSSVNQVTMVPGQGGAEVGHRLGWRRSPAAWGGFSSAEQQLGKSSHHGARSRRGCWWALSGARGLALFLVTLPASGSGSAEHSQTVSSKFFNAHQHGHTIV
jgi:hypothetical protein